jgi:hypothetical protein
MLQEIIYIVLISLTHKYFYLNSVIGVVILFVLFLFYQRNDEKEINKDFVDVLPNMFYKSLDFNKCRIGGSYALCNYLKNQKWEPNDVDIFYFTNDFDEFSNYTTTLVKNTNSKMIQGPTNDEGLIYSLFSQNKQEFFKSVLGIASFDFPQIKFTIRMIAIKIDPNYIGTQMGGVFLSSICDLPACISYIHKNDKLEYYIPDIYRFPIIIKKLPHMNQDEERVLKYINRGFEFIKC